MNRFRISKLICAVIAAALVCQAKPLFACAMCYGQKTDSPLAAGMNWGIMSLLVVLVLSSIASFFVFLAKKAAAVGAAPAPTQGETSDSNKKA